MHPNPPSKTEENSPAKAFFLDLYNIIWDLLRSFHVGFRSSGDNSISYFNITHISTQFGIGFIEDVNFYNYSWGIPLTIDKNSIWTSADNNNRCSYMLHTFFHTCKLNLEDVCFGIGDSCIFLLICKGFICKRDRTNNFYYCIEGISVHFNI